MYIPKVRRLTVLLCNVFALGIFFLPIHSTAETVQNHNILLIVVDDSKSDLHVSYDVWETINTEDSNTITKDIERVGGVSNLVIHNNTIQITYTNRKAESQVIDALQMHFGLTEHVLYEKQHFREEELQAIFAEYLR